MLFSRLIGVRRRWKISVDLGRPKLFGSFFLTVFVNFAAALARPGVARYKSQNR